MSGLKLEYTEGIVTLTLEIRTNYIGKSEMSQIQRFAEVCNEIWTEVVITDEGVKEKIKPESEEP